MITVVQHTGAESIAPGATSKTTNLRLNFNHPCKTLIWAIKGEKHGQFTTGARGTDNDRYAPLQSAKLQLNGHDRMDERTGAYYNSVQSWEHIKTKPSAGVYMVRISSSTRSLTPPLFTRSLVRSLARSLAHFLTLAPHFYLTLSFPAVLLLAEAG